MAPPAHQASKQTPNPDMVETQLEFESQIPADWEAPSGEREVQEQSLAKVGRVDQGKSQEEGAEEEERTDDECVSPAPYDSDPRVARLPHEPTLKRGLASEQLPGSTGSLELSGPPAKSPKLGSASSTKPEDDPNAKAPKPAEPRAAPGFEKSIFLSYPCIKKEHLAYKNNILSWHVEVFSWNVTTLRHNWSIVHIYLRC